MRERLPMAGFCEDFEKLLTVIDRGSPVGKRDYAILSLISNLGIRATDVFALKKENFNFPCSRLDFIQRKSSQPVSLPLQGDTGHAVIDYLKNGRPDCETSFVFVSHSNDSLGTPLRPGYVYILLEKYMRLLGVRLTARQIHGLYLLRHQRVS